MFENISQFSLKISDFHRLFVVFIKLLTLYNINGQNAILFIYLIIQMTKNNQSI